MTLHVGLAEEASQGPRETVVDAFHMHSDLN